MAVSQMSCTKCLVPLSEEVFNTVDPVPCPHCGNLIQVHVFPSFFKTLSPGQAGEMLLVDEESSCYYHPQKRAKTHCESCGRFLCSLCDVELNNQHLCPSCLEIGAKKGKFKNLQNKRKLYDNIALSLAIYPLLFCWLTIITAPITIYVAIRYWNAPLSIGRRSKIRFVIAIAIALIEILVWFVSIIFMVLS